MSHIKSPIKNSFLESNLVYITSKSPAFEHTPPCIPSVTQFMYTNRTAGKYVSNISDAATFTLIGLLKDTPNIQSSTIRSLLKQNFPSKGYISNNDIYNSKIRCYRLMPLYEECNLDFQAFMANMKEIKTAME